MVRTALITGATAGIGRACSFELARKGLAVGVLGRDLGECRKVAAEIETAGGNAVALEADITDRAQVEAAADMLRNRLGPITVLVNNAGVSDFKAFEHLSEGDWRQMFDVNVLGTFIVTQTCLPDMKTAGWGRIVNISSSSAQSGSPFQAHYSASKGAVMAMTRSLAQELGAHGITVNTIPPGSVLGTKMAEANKAKFGIEIEDLAKLLPVGRTGIPEDVAAACAWLVSEEAGYVTGQTIGVNGGRVMA